MWPLDLGKVIKRTIKADDGVIADDKVETASIKNLNVTTAKIADANVTHAKLAADAVENDNIKNLAVSAGKIQSGSITKTQLALFVSAEQTGTGAEQDVAHGFAGAPSAVWFTDVDGAGPLMSSAATATVVKVTATVGKKFYVFALA